MSAVIAVVYTSDPRISLCCFQHHKNAFTRRSSSPNFLFVFVVNIVAQNERDILMMR